LKEELAHYHKKSAVSDILEKLQKGDKVQLKLVLKADTFGSLEALKGAVNKVELPENVEIDVIRADVGPVSDNDILLADASKAVVIGFNVPLTHSIKKKAENLKVDVKNFNIIYEVIDYLTNLAQGLVKPEEKEVDIGKLEVL
jgi:translation initiation factor IF-2